MLIDAAKARLRLRLQASQEPVLTDQELQDLLTIHALEDVNGVIPNGDGWVGTWDFAGALREGWLVKAAKVVPDITYMVDGAQYTMSDMHKHCLEMADRVAGIGLISVGVE
jgi:hypothetical protein